MRSLFSQRVSNSPSQRRLDVVVVMPCVVFSNLVDDVGWRSCVTDSRLSGVFAREPSADS